MAKLVIRHGLSEANNRANYGTPAFGSPNAPLTPKGREQASELGSKLITRYGIDMASTPVATSTLLRTVETALVAGFRHLHIYPELDEEKGGLNDQELRAALENRQPPAKTIEAVDRIIAEPPEEGIIVMHAFLIATMCQRLGVYQDERFTPNFCEIREIPL